MKNAPYSNDTKMGFSQKPSKPTRYFLEGLVSHCNQITMILYSHSVPLKLGGMMKSTSRFLEQFSIKFLEFFGVGSNLI